MRHAIQRPVARRRTRATGRVLLAVTSAVVAALVPAAQRASGVAGTAVTASSTPWTVHLAAHTPGVTYLCGGALISPQWVVTAAHCVDMPAVTSIQVTAGDYTAANDGTEQVRNASLPITTLGYREHGTGVDVALVKLASPFTRTAAIKPVALPPRGYPLPASLDVAGWGSGQQLGMATVRIVRCVGPSFQVCYLSKALGAGDSGSPMAARAANGTPYLAGVVDTTMSGANIASGPVWDWITSTTKILPAQLPEPSWLTFPVSASSEAATSHIQQLTDGVLFEGGYRSASSSTADHQQWLVADLGWTRTVRRVLLTGTLDANGAVTGWPAQFMVQLSNDPTFPAATTVTVGTVAHTAAASAQVSFSTVRSGRYLRVLATRLGAVAGAPGQYAMAFSELGVYGA